MIKKALLLILVILISLNILYAQEYTTNTDAKEPSCLDTDGGINYLVQGTASSSPSRKTDNCKSTQVLEEFYCSGDKITSQLYRCNVACDQGACSQKIQRKTDQPIQKSPSITQEPSNIKNSEGSTCKDTDNGINFFVTGTATIYNPIGQPVYTSTDICASETILYEKYCKFSSNRTTWTIEQLNHRCTCTNGRCLQLQEQSQSTNNLNNIQSSPPKPSLFQQIMSLFSFQRNSPTGSATQSISKNAISSSWVILLIFIIIALIYLRKIYKTPEVRKKKLKRKKV